MGRTDDQTGKEDFDVAKIRRVVRRERRSRRSVVLEHEEMPDQGMFVMKRLQ